MSLEAYIIDMVNFLEAEDSTSRLAINGQNPANNYHWTRSIGRGVDASELLKVFKLAQATINIGRVLGRDNLPDRQNPLCDPHQTDDIPF